MKPARESGGNRDLPVSRRGMPEEGEDLQSDGPGTFPKVELDGGQTIFLAAANPLRRQRPVFVCSPRFRKTLRWPGLKIYASDGTGTLRQTVSPKCQPRLATKFQ
jgi:hypothetical protein